MEFHVIIPARYGSSRLPGKLLLDLAGKPMLEHVYLKAVDSGAESVVIATDSEEIEQVAKNFGATVCMTSADHQSGTERLSEVVEVLEYESDEIIVCVQGDEPLIVPDIIYQVAEDLDEFDNVKVASLYQPIKDVDLLFDPNIVKVVLNRRNHAIYFSRAPIPWGRESFSDKESIELNGSYNAHIGLYAYRVSFLRDYMGWSSCQIEDLELLEQLRILWNGGRIHMSQAKSYCPAGVDTQEDLVRVQKLLKAKV